MLLLRAIQGLVEYGALQPGAAQGPLAVLQTRLRQFDTETYLMIGGALVLGWMVWNAFVGGRR